MNESPSIKDAKGMMRGIFWCLTRADADDGSRRVEQVELADAGFL